MADDHAPRGGRDDAAVEARRPATPPPLFADTDDTAMALDAAVGGVPLSLDAAAFLRRHVDVNATSAPRRGDFAGLEQLHAENEQLRAQVADLAGALKARDLEIAALRERCRSLLRSIEQQDETIAKIYAVTSPATVDALQTQSKRTPTTLRGVDVAAKHTEAAPPGSVLGEALDRLLHAVPSPPSSTMTSSSTAKVPLTSTARHGGRMSLFDDEHDASSATTDDTSPSSCSSTLSKSSSGRAFERRESCASEEDFVKSAGFLRKPSRRASGRLSISDFGLLDDAASADELGVADEEAEEEEDAAADNQPADDGEEAPEGDGGNQDEEGDDEKKKNGRHQRGVLSRSKSEDLHKKCTRSTRNLFADIDAPKGKPKSVTAASASAAQRSPNSNNHNQDADAADGDESDLTYGEFLERLRMPASRDLLETIRTFLASILGPRGDVKPPRATDFVDYAFYGTHELRRRCVYFFQSMEELLASHPLWRHASEATLAKARDGVEKYVMDKLEHIAMNELDECRGWKEEDDRLLRRMKLLSFITPDMLDIKPCMRNEVVWSMAEDELRRINSFRSPGDKINCIVRCCSIIFSVLNLARGDSGSRPGADDFLPVFIYIVLHSRIPRLHSNCEYIAAYRNPNDLMSKAGYCFVNLRSAIEFLSVVDGSMLSVSEDEFTRLYEHEERKLLTAVE